MSGKSLHLAHALRVLSLVCFSFRWRFSGLTFVCLSRLVVLAVDCCLFRLFCGFVVWGFSTGFFGLATLRSLPGSWAPPFCWVLLRSQPGSWVSWVLEASNQVLGPPCGCWVLLRSQPGSWVSWVLKASNQVLGPPAIVVITPGSWAQTIFFSGFVFTFDGL